jgi:hypothetical protein
MWLVRSFNPIALDAVYRSFSTRDCPVHSLLNQCVIVVREMTTVDDSLHK